MALVTGARTGIGRATALRLAQEGWCVYGTSRDGAAVSRFPLLPLELGDPASIAACVGEVLGRERKIDLLVANAGEVQTGAVEEVGAAELRAHLDGVIGGNVRLLQAVLPGMRARREGRVVLVGSALVGLPSPFLGIHAAAKAALQQIGLALREELRPHGIRVAIVLAAACRTRLRMRAPASAFAAYQPAREGLLEQLRDLMEHGTDPEEVARVIAAAARAPNPRAIWRAGAQAKLLGALPTAVGAALVRARTAGAPRPAIVPAVPRARPHRSRA